jgi:hypothetical protein
MKTTNASILGIKWRWTLEVGFSCGVGRWKLCNIETTDAGQWKRRIDGRSWGQNNIDFKTSNYKQIIGW